MNPSANWRITKEELDLIRKQFPKNETIVQTQVQTMECASFAPTTFSSTTSSYVDSCTDSDRDTLNDETYYMTTLFSKQNIRKVQSLKNASRLSQLIRMDTPPPSPSLTSNSSVSDISDNGNDFSNAHVSDPSWCLTKVKKGKLVRKDSQGKSRVHCWSDVHSHMIW